MYRFEITKSLAKERGDLKAVIVITDADENCTKHILKDGDSDQYHSTITIFRKNFALLDLAVEKYLIDAKVVIDEIRKNHKLMRELGEIKQAITY